MGKDGFKITISGAMIAAALIWCGTIQAKVEKIESFYDVVRSIDKRLSRIEGAMKIKAENESAEKGE